MHNPHETNVNNNNNNQFGNVDNNSNNEDKVTFLNINNHITAVACGPVDPKPDGKDMLCIGTRTNLLAYNVDENTRFIL